MSYVERVFKLIWLSWIALAIFGWAVIALEVTGYRVGFDATDSATERSGLGLHTDFGTGCQYLTTFFGGLTPRLGPDGKQICGARL